jgi:dihydroflavonol-4-reductase
MIAFVTGGTGFVGGHLCERVRAEGWTVRALVRDRSRSQHLAKCGCRLVPGDLFSREAISRAVRRADLIIHLAGLTKTPKLEDFQTVNAGGTASLVQAALDAGFKGRFIHVSSQAAVGPAVDGRPRNECDSPAPVSEYGRSKLRGEEIVRNLGARFKATILRPGAIYGPREHDIYEQIRAVRRTGLAIIPGKPFDIQLTHVDDVVEAIILAAANAKTAGREYMLTDPTIWSSQQVAETMGSALGCRVRSVCVPMPFAWTVASCNDALSKIRGRAVSALTRDKVRELSRAPWLADSSRLARDANWRPRWDLPSGLSSTIEWYRDNGWL